MDVVVIGAGALGTTTAYHLATHRKRVALVERFAAASQTSPRAAGLTQQMRASEVMSRLARRSCALIASFEADTGEPMTFFRSGSIKLARLAAHESQLQDEVQLLARRFAPAYSDEVRLRAACRTVYEFQYWAERPSGTWADQAERLK